jgi:hypothetical protein
MSFGDAGNAALARVGTTPPIFVPRGDNPAVVKPGQYFRMQIVGAQAAYRGSVFERAQQLVVTSRVNLHHDALGRHEFEAIQRQRQVQRNQSVQLGLAPNLIDLVPATMSSVSVSIDFILDVQSQLSQLSKLINGDKFLSAISLAPGALAVAKTIGGLADEVLNTFVPEQRKQPLLQFAGDFNLAEGAANAMRDGYYVILGSADEKTPLPVPWPRLAVQNGALLANNNSVSGLSYVILDITWVPARTRQMSGGAAWDGKLREAERLVKDFGRDPSTDKTKFQETWDRCKALLIEAHGLLMADANYAPDEAEAIYESVYQQCVDAITPKARPRRRGAVAPAVDTELDRRMLSIPGDADLAERAASYAEQVAQAEAILKESKLL